MFKFYLINFSEFFFFPRYITWNWVSFIAKHIIFYPTQKVLNYTWSFGSLLGIGLVIQIITGIILAKHYTANIDLAFYSVEHIMRDVNSGYIIRYTHSNGSSMLFILLYLHMFRGIFYGSYVNKLLLWWSGILLFLLMMGTAFLGYVLPWGQMSFWGATVITNLASVIPAVGDSIVQWFWGGFSITNATLVRFFAYHYAIPFIILGVVILHLSFLHLDGSNTSLGVSSSSSNITFYPYFYVKDLFAFLSYVLILSVLVFYMPNYLGHPDNYIVANPMVTPSHIVPEWYFLPFYAILRSIPNKLFGVIGMLGAILLLGLFPVTISNSTIRGGNFRPLYKKLFYLFIATFILLGWFGQKSATPSIVLLAQYCTTLYFFLLVNMLLISYYTRFSLYIPEEFFEFMHKVKVFFIMYGTFACLYAHKYYSLFSYTLSIYYWRFMIRFNWHHVTVTYMILYIFR